MKKQKKIIIIALALLTICSSFFIVYKHYSSAPQSLTNTKYIFPDIPTTYKGVLGLPFPINTTIVKSGDTYQNTTNRFKTYFKNNPTLQNSITFKNDASQISFYTPVNQSFGQLQNTTPLTKGSTITYPDIFSSLDLRYTVSSKRLLEEFVVKDKETAMKILDINQGVSLTNIDKYTKNPDGSISFFSNGKITFAVPQPVLYEQENRDIISHGIEYQVTGTGKDSLQITKKITQEGADWLADPTRQYPIVIDLVIDNADTYTNWVSSDTNNTVVTQENTIKHEGTGSVKVVTSAQPTNTTIDLMEYSTDTTAQTAYVTSSTFAATGGDSRTINGSNEVHTYTTVGSSTFTALSSGNVAVLVVAGGGAGGGDGGGGGGGGQCIYNPTFNVSSSGTYTVTVGDGGTAQVRYSGNNGNPSVFSSITATAGGGGGGGYSSGGTSGSGYAGGAGSGSTYNAGGGGGGDTAIGQDANKTTAGNGGAGSSYTIQNGSSLQYGGGGGGGSYTGGSKGNGVYGGGNGVVGANTGNPGTSNTGGGGGGGGYASPSSHEAGGHGGSGTVIVSFPTNPCYPNVCLQSYSGTTVTQGSYSLKGIAQATNSLNQTLTKNVSLDLSNAKNLTFDMQSTRTGSNIQVSIYDSNGTTTSITPNITSANAWQHITWDISGVANANKNSISKIIITITNANALNTFYIDNFIDNGGSVNNTVTLTKSPANADDLSGQYNVTFWVYSTVAGSFAQFQFGQSSSSENTYNFTINSPNTWQQVTWDIHNLSPTRTAVKYYAFKFISNTGGATFYFDDIESNTIPIAPTLDLPANNATNQMLLPQFQFKTTDADNDYLEYKIQICTNSGMSTGCLTAIDETSSQTGWSNQNYPGGGPYTAYTSNSPDQEAIYTTQAQLSGGITYYWQAFAKDPGGSNNWSNGSSVNSFTTSNIPSVPIVNYPTNGANGWSQAPTLSMSSTDANSDYLRYEVKICTTSDMSTSCLNSGSWYVEPSGLPQTGWTGQDTQGGTAYASTPSSGTPFIFSSTLTTGVTYYWQAQAIDPGGSNIWSGPSLTYSFTMGQPNVPSALQVDGTTDPASLTDQTPNFTAICNSGNSGDTFNKYEIIVSTSPTFSSTTYDSGASGTSMTSCTAGSRSSNLAYVGTLALDGTVYYWKIRFFDTGGSGTWSNWSNELATFKMSSSYDNTPLTCSAGTLGAQDSSIMVQWTDSAGVTAFELQRSTDGGVTFSDLAGYTGSGTSYVDSTTSSGNTYEYRVKATSGGGSGWCTTGLVSLQRGVFQFR